ncbi:OmpL47-type beta-barrel domain-containing protein [Gordoniibacillus kamchatkensis]|uniref:OmpL47-type beta-barrel domain-containing protein n=1 Tax=Gordoniibacillus kamchatkensis TaxID=1590651 RepID=UPI0006964B37|nr:hypothetical protein [Paenibacillus sp. VKM B-2647]
MKQFIRENRPLFLLLGLLLLFSSIVPAGSAFAAGDPVPQYESVPVSLNNPGFEDVSGGKAVGWSYWTSGYLYGMSVSDTVYKEGSHSLKLDVLPNKTMGVESAKVDVVPGQRYRVTTSVYSDTYDPALTSSMVRIWLRFYNDGAQVKDFGVNVPNSNLPQGQWTDLTVEGVAPANANKATVLFYADKASAFSAYFDNVRMVQLVPVAPGGRTLQNGGFEAPSTDAGIPGWKPYPDTLPAGYSVSLSTEQSFEGTNSVRIDDGGASSVGLISSPIDVVAGRGYSASVMAYISSRGVSAPPGSGGVSLYLKYYDSADNEVGSFAKSAKSPVDGWVPLRVEAVAPVNASYAKLWLYSSTGTVGTSYYDNAKFEEVAMLTLPYEYAQPVSLGDATVVAKNGGAAVGNGEVYFGATGAPATFYAVDAFTGQVHFSAPMPGSDTVWAVTVGSDGNAYVSGMLTGILYRYNPAQKKLENLGVNPSNKVVWDLDASSDGKIYGSTYPNSKAFVYDIAAAQFTDLGTILQGQDYARGGGVTDKYFYVGTGPIAHLFRIDRSTGEKTEIQLSITGTDNFVSNVWSYGGRLFVAYGTSLLVLDEKDYSELKKISWDSALAFDGRISPPSPYNPNLIYYRNKTTAELWSYDISSNEVAPVTPAVKLFTSGVTGLNWQKLPDGPNAGRDVLVMLSNNVELAIYDPVDNTVTLKPTDVAKSGILIQSLEAGPGNKLVMGGYTAAMSMYDLTKGAFEHQEAEPSQIEGMGSLNGKMYWGTYGGAVIYRYDPEKPFELRKNPGIVYDIGDDQDRPFGFDSGDGKLFIGTVPDYGHLGGALTIFDEEKNTWNTYRNLIQNQSIIGVAYHNGKVYGGSSLSGGLGINPTETEAKMFEFDVATATKTAEFKPNVPGFGTPKMIGDLKMGPDNLLWGIMWGLTADGQNGYALFAMNPDTKQVVKSRIQYTGDTGSTWRPFYLRWGSDGLLYTTIGRQLIAFDPNTLAARQLVNGSVSLMTLGPDGSIYYALDAKLMKMTPRMTSASLSAGQTELTKGQQTDLTVSLQLVNNKIANSAGTEISYTVSDPSVVQVENGKVVALKSGTASISATVKQDTAVKTTNTITVTVVDKVPPVTRATLDTNGAQPVNGWYTVPATVYLSAEDDDSGVQLTEFRVNDGAWEPYGQGIVFDQDGSYTLEYRSTDRAGNREDSKFLNVKIDRTAPVISPPSTLTFLQTDPIQPVFQITDAASGVNEITANLDGASAAYPLQLPPVQLSVGDHALHIRATDHAGNVSEADFTLKVTIDLSHFADLILDWAEQTTDHGFSQSMLTKVQNDLKAADNHSNPNSDRVVVNVLNALENEVQAQSGKKMPQHFAALLLQDIQYLRNQYSQ